MGEIEPRAKAILERCVTLDLAPDVADDTAEPGGTLRPAGWLQRSMVTSSRQARAGHGEREGAAAVFDIGGRRPSWSFARCVSAGGSGMSGGIAATVQ